MQHDVLRFSMKVACDMSETTNKDRLNSCLVAGTGTLLTQEKTNNSFMCHRSGIQMSYAIRHDNMVLAQHAPPANRPIDLMMRAVASWSVRPDRTRLAA